MLNRHTLQPYAVLLRLDKPIGILLLLWPTLWALWMAGNGCPDNRIVSIFIAGVILMRSAGCVLNDIADRHFDGRVARTRERPLASGKISLTHALILAAILILSAFLLVLLCNAYTIALAFAGAGLAAVYPYLKRVTHLPQFGLGLAFTWGVPMAFAAETGAVGWNGWLLFLTGMVWPVIYDTMYAMVDRSDDRKIGVKSTAILFDTWDTLIIGLLQAVFVLMLVIIGFMFHLHAIYYVSLIVVTGLFAYQQWLIKDRDRQRCFQAFLNNNWVGLSLFAGIYLSYHA